MAFNKKEYNKELYQKNKEEILKKCKEYYEKNKHKKKNCFCMDCGKNIWNGYKRCLKCSHDMKRKEIRKDVKDRANEIIEKYNNDIPIIKIASIFKCNPRLISKILKESKSSVKNGSSRILIGKRDEIVKMYLDGLSAQQIAKNIGFGRISILNILKQKKVKLRPIEYYVRNYFKGKKRPEITGELNPACNPEVGKKISDKLKGRTFSKETIQKMSAKKQGIPLEEWEKFVSREPYDQNWTPKFRREIRKRDNQICMLCEIHREKLSEAFIIHHINQDKNLTVSQNCISLCRKCHTLIHSDKNKKEYWTKFFQSLLAEKYDYQYSENGEIILNLNQKEV